jgi:cell wall-associated NlpC family hydrolase
MEGQLKMNVPWAIIPLDEERTGQPIVWGGDTPVPALVGRQFQHGITDCYAIIRDTFRLGREELAKQDIDWPYAPIELPEVPRDDAWWMLGEDLYIDHFAKFGFVEINYTLAQPGDVFLVAVKCETINHGGVLIGGGLIMQHFPERLSQRTPAGLWARHANKWIRYVGGDQSMLTDVKEQKNAS